MTNIKTSEWMEYLEEKYFDANWPASFQGAIKVRQSLKNDGYTPVTIKSIQSWLDKQDVYSLHKRVRRSKLKQARVSVHEVNEFFDCDLAFIPGFEKENNGFIGFMCVVDVLSRFCRVHLIKTKKATEIISCLKSVLADIKLQVLRTDSGGEFVGAKVKAYLNSINVKHVISHSIHKACYAEILIKSLKSRLFKMMTHNNSPVWYNKLESIVDSYNKTVHSSHGFKPIEVTHDNAFLVQYHEYLNRKKRTGKLNPKIREDYKYKINDTVRISYIKNAFHRQYDISYSGEVFTIRKRYRRQGLAVYQLSEWNQNPIQGVFYSHELIPAHIGDNHTFKIEKILRRRGKGKKREVLVRWLYYSSAYDSWLSESELKNIVKN